MMIMVGNGGKTDGNTGRRYESFCRPARSGEKYSVSIEENHLHEKVVA